MKPLTTATLIIALLLRAASLEAFSVSLGAPGEYGISRKPSAVYASTSSGDVVQIASLEMRAPGSGNVIEDLGLPALTSDGKVVFGAALRDTHGHVRWGIFIGNPDAKVDKDLLRELPIKSDSASCTPLLNIDPFVVAGGPANGPLFFVGAEAHKKDAVFSYRDGIVKCLARTGDHTVEGDVIKGFAFGSLQATDNSVVLGALLDEGRHAVVLVSRTGEITEVAVEAARAPGGGIYGAGFSRPAAVSGPSGAPMVAFSDRTSSGAALFLYANGSTSRLLGSGSVTDAGTVSYISEGKPGITSDGTVAAKIGCSLQPALVAVGKAGPHVILRAGDVTRDGTQLTDLLDPLMSSGLMFAPAETSDDRELVFVLRWQTAPRSSPVAVRTSSVLYTPPRIQMFNGSFTVNLRGDSAFLGNPSGAYGDL